MTKERDRTDDPKAFAAALAVVDGSTPYLGDAVVIEAVLRDALRRVLPAVGTDSVVDVVKATCRRVAAVLLGDDDNYAPDPSLHAPGKIDDLCATWFGSTETDARKRMEHCVLMFLSEVLGLLPDDGQDPAPYVRDLMNAAISKYASAFVGIPPAMYAILRTSSPNDGVALVDDFVPEAE